jgi:hypothetical protein
MKTNNGGGVLALVLLACSVFAISALVSYAANNTAPSGWLMVNRDRARWALGTPGAVWGGCSATNTIPATGLAAGDSVWGVVNCTTLAETMTAYGSTLTVAANSLTSSATPWTAGNVYLVLYHRPKATDR